jgi:hypothetical protein
VTGKGSFSGYRILEKNLQGFPGAAAEIGKKLPNARSGQMVIDIEQRLAYTVRQFTWASGVSVAGFSYFLFPAER